MFEPRFYERAAQRYIAAQCYGSTFINVPWGYEGGLDTRDEIDAILRRSGRLVAVEVKSHPTTLSHCETLIAKYARLGFRDLILIAPAVDPAGARLLAASRQPLVQFVGYAPDLVELRDWYVTNWPAFVPDWTQVALLTGKHYVRFILAQRGETGGFAIGQTRSRIYRAESIGAMMARLPAPPARILWSPQRFTTPRDLGARGSKLTALGGYVAVDVDGDRLHRSKHSCEITARIPYCIACQRYAWRELNLLLTELDGIAPVALVSSGGRGVHAYFHDTGTVRREILQVARRHRLRIDEGVTASDKTTIALPGSLNAGTMVPVMNGDWRSPSWQEVTVC